MSPAYATVYDIAAGGSEDRVLATWGWLALVALGLVMAAAAISNPRQTRDSGRRLRRAPLPVTAPG